MATATESTILEAQPRTAGTKNDARRVRREGKVPGVLYGAGKQALSVTLDPRQISRILIQVVGRNRWFGEAHRLSIGRATKCTHFIQPGNSVRNFYLSIIFRGFGNFSRNARKG